MWQQHPQQLALIRLHDQDRGIGTVGSNRHIIVCQLARFPRSWATPRGSVSAEISDQAGLRKINANTYRILEYILARHHMRLVATLPVQRDGINVGRTQRLHDARIEQAAHVGQHPRALVPVQMLAGQLQLSIGSAETSFRFRGLLCLGCTRFQLALLAGRRLGAGHVHVLVR